MAYFTLPDKPTFNRIVHLSDGTAVFLHWAGWNGTSFVRLFHTGTGHLSPVAAAEISTLFRNTTTLQQFCLVRDAADNLYVIGQKDDGRDLRAHALTKGSGYAWTAQAALISDPMTEKPEFIAAEWCDTGGGTNGKGHIMVVYASGSTATKPGGYLVLDAGALLAGSGAFVVSGALGPTFLGTGANATAGPNLDISQDGFGAASGLATSATSATTASVGAWSINSSGLLVTNTNLTSSLATGTLNMATRLRLVRVAPGRWGLVYRSTVDATHWMVARFSNAALLTAGVDCGAPADFRLNGGDTKGDAFCDPVVADQLWLRSWGAGASDRTLRLRCDLSAGVVFDAAAVDDTLGFPINTVPDTAAMACVQPAGSFADWDGYVTAGSTYGGFSDFSPRGRWVVGAVAIG